MAMQEVVIASAARTPFGLYMGSLKDQRQQDLAAISEKEAVNRAGIDSALIDLVIYGQAMQSSFPANVGRHAWLLAGLDQDVAGFAINALCAGGLQSIISAFNKIKAEEYSKIVVGGIESFSQAHYFINHPRYQFGEGNTTFHDSKKEVATNAQPVDIYGELSPATLADIVAENYGFSRSQLDEYTLASKAKAAAAVANMKDAIVAVVKKVKKKEITVDIDEGAKATTIEQLMALPVVNSGGTATSANVAPWADGSATMIMMTPDQAQKLGCKTLAKMVGYGIAAGNPKLAEITTVKSIEKAVKNAGITLKDLDFIDIHEMSAAYSLAVINKLGQDVADKVNVDGGSLAYGHAGAATGAAMAVNMVYRLQRSGAKYGLVNIAAYGGQSLSVVIAR
jgi:acetyl-CoA C-acetyltransferase